MVCVQHGDWLSSLSWVTRRMTDACLSFSAAYVALHVRRRWFIVMSRVTDAFSQHRHTSTSGRYQLLSNLFFQFQTPVYCRAMLCFAGVRWLTGWLTVTFVYWVETAKYSAIVWNTNRKLYPSFRTVAFSVTLNDVGFKVTIFFTHQIARKR